MLNYQSTSYHDAMAVRRLLGLRPSPEFASWLESRGLPSRPSAIVGTSTRDGMLDRLAPVLEQLEGSAR
jgi:ethanolamine ammonia-lyase large subunit